MWKDTLVLQTRTTGGGLFYCLLQKVVHTVTCQRRTAGIRKSQPSATFAQFPEPRLKSFGCCRPQRDRALLPPFSCKTDERLHAKTELLPSQRCDLRYSRAGVIHGVCLAGGQKSTVFHDSY